jgi:hypothetical protein
VLQVGFLAVLNVVGSAEEVNEGLIKDAQPATESRRLC